MPGVYDLAAAGLARHPHVLRGRQRVLFGADLERSRSEDCAGFRRARQGRPYWFGGTASGKPGLFPCSHLWALGRRPHRHYHFFPWP